MSTTTKAAAHTPGPWRYFDNARGDAFLVERPVGEDFEYRVGLVGNANGDPQNEANARLIAAAPEMLEALEQFECPDCNHLLKYHVDEYGCEVERGDRPGNEGEPAEAMGPCGCNANYGPGLDPKYFAPELAAIAVMRKVRGDR